MYVYDDCAKRRLEQTECVRRAIQSFAHDGVTIEHLLPRREEVLLEYRRVEVVVSLLNRQESMGIWG